MEGADDTGAWGFCERKTILCDVCLLVNLAMPNYSGLARRLTLMLATLAMENLMKHGRLRLLPSELLVWILHLYERVEERGSWLAELRQSEGLLLPKAGGDGTSDRRPI